VPSVAIYKTNFLSAFLGKKLINMNNIILPNWILGNKYIKFLFQENCNPQNIAKEIINLIKNKNEINRSNLNAKNLRKLLTANKKTFNENVSDVVQYHLNL
jgi:lipid-A-disaccharide synthase